MQLHTGQPSVVGGDASGDLNADPTIPALLAAYYQHYMLDLMLSDKGKAAPGLNLAIADVTAQMSMAFIGALASAAHACSNPSSDATMPVADPHQSYRP